jgi:hypothetical protein
MCAKVGEDRIETIKPPSGSQAGDLITIGNKRDPVTEINPKKSQWDLVKDKVKINDSGIAVYNDNVEWVTQKGKITSSLKGGVIS